MIQRFLRAVRTTGEVLVLGLALPFFAVGILRNGAGARRRWGRWLTSGLGPVRTAWWEIFRLESRWTWWRQVFLLESFALAGRGHDAARGSGPVLPVGGRLLIVRLGHLGDILHTVPFAVSCRRQRPDVHIDIVVGPWCVALARRFSCFDDVIEYAPDFVQFHRGDRSKVPSVRRSRAVLETLGQRGYAAALASSPWHLSDHIVFAAAAPRWVLGAAGGLPDTVPAAADRRRPFDSQRREADWVAGFLADLGLEPAESTALSIPVSATEREKAASLLASLPARRIVIAPGSGWTGKCWLPERFAALADRLAAALGVGVVLVGSPGERQLAEAVAGAMTVRPLNLAGGTSVGESVAVLEQCTLLIGNDSAPLHFAAAVGTSSLALFGPTSASKWAPTGNNHRVLQHRDMCGGCCYWHPAATCAHERRCMAAITVEEAYAAAVELLEGAHPSS